MYVGNAEPPDTSTFRRPPRLSLCITDRYNYTHAAPCRISKGRTLRTWTTSITAIYS